MVFFWLVMAVLVLEGLLSFWWFKYLWKRVPQGIWRLTLALAIAGVVLAVAWLVLARAGWLPKVQGMTALGMIWLILMVPFGLAPGLVGIMVWQAFRRLRVLPKVRRHQASPVHEKPTGAQVLASSWTRRRLLATSLAIAPLATTYAAAGVGVAQMWSFRRRRLQVPVTGLPPALEGLRILHLSDTHVGGFTPDENLAAIAKAVAEEKPELILFTGDLVDHSNAALPVSLAFCEKLRKVAPLFFCEGNHDRIDDAMDFRRRLKAAGFNLLVDGQAQVLALRGQRVQVLGAPWSHRDHGAAVAQATAHRDGQAFPILLAHHPDAFDAAQAADFPLMLAGHSHGGQLMLTEKLGAGSVMFNYWSGLYRKGKSSLVVSNGAGHWFPLRVNAPAEIGVLTLQAA